MIVRVAAYLPDLEEHALSYGGPRLVDELRASLRQQRLLEDPPCAGLLLPAEAWLSSTLPDPARRRLLQRAVLHYHASRWPRRDAAAAIPLVTLAEARRHLDFAVKRLGYTTAVVAGDLSLLPALRSDVPLLVDPALEELPLLAA